MRVIFALVLMLVAVLPVHAVQPDEVLSDPALEQRARDLSAGLRCMVCQNQSIDDSDAPLARDLRLLVRERLEAGDTDGEVLTFLTDRYGEFVLLRPPLRWGTALLWAFPALLLLVGLSFLAFRSRSRPKDEAKLTTDEEKEVQRLAAEDRG